MPCFHYDSSCGRPSCKHTLCCIWVPSLVQAILKKLSRSQNCSLSGIWLFFLPSSPLCGPFHAFHMGGSTSCQLTLCCIWALCLDFVTFPLVGAPLTNLPCIAFGHPALFLLRFLMWAPLLQTHLALHLVTQPFPCHFEKVKSKPKLFLIRHLAHLLS
jgi:hypothetical protein